MAGHSKWANIQHRKKAQDAKRSRLFTMLIREISSAARVGGAKPESNPRLRLAVDKAMAANVSKEIIERAVRRGAGEMEGESCEEIRYEGFAANGVALMVDCLSDNRNRTVAEVRRVFTRFDGNLGQSGCVSHLFRQRGILSFSAAVDEDDLLAAAVDMDIEDLRSDAAAGTQLLLAPARLFEVREQLERCGFQAQSAELEEEADNLIALDAEAAATVKNMITALLALDDVQAVYSNADFANNPAARVTA